MLVRRVVLVSLVGASLLFAACGGDNQKSGADRTTTSEATAMTTASGGGTTAPTVPMETHFTITAKNVAFTPTSLNAPANEPLEVTFDNEDAGVAHNLHFKTPTEQKTDVKQGVDKETLTFTVSKPGTYDFVCDVHPTMKGSLKVS